MNDVGRGDHATFRELKAMEDGLQKRMGVIELEQASQRAALQHVPEDIRQLTQAVNALAARMPTVQQQPDTMSLAVHRLVDALDKDRQRPTPAAELVQALKNRPTGLPWLLTGGVGALALMLGWQLFTGG